MTAWLFTIEQELDDLAVGQPFVLWSDPPRETATGNIRTRSDGEPFTSAWSVGDNIIVFHPRSGRCVARLAIAGDSRWEELDELFYLDTIVGTFDRDGPTLADVVISKALQGGRHRLTAAQYLQVLKWFREKREHEGLT